jgi:hypothetical protein
MREIVAAFLVPVDVGCVVAPVRDWISRARVTRDRQSLATAAAETLKTAADNWCTAPSPSQ